MAVSYDRVTAVGTDSDRVPAVGTPRNCPATGTPLNYLKICVSMNKKPDRGTK